VSVIRCISHIGIPAFIVFIGESLGTRRTISLIVITIRRAVLLLWPPIIPYPDSIVQTRGPVLYFTRSTALNGCKRAFSPKSVHVFHGSCCFFLKVLVLLLRYFGSKHSLFFISVQGYVFLVGQCLNDRGPERNLSGLSNFIFPEAA